MFFLHHAKPTTFKKSYRMMEEYKKTLIDNHCDLDKYIIDTVLVLSIFGLRETSDLDYCTIEESIKPLFVDKAYIEEHGCSNYFSDREVIDAISSPSNYFCFNELKFVSLRKLLDFKIKRCNGEQDAKDVWLIKSLLDKDSNKWQVKYDNLIINCRWRIRMIHRSYRQMRKDILVSFHLYEPLRSLKKRIKKYY